MMRIVTLADSKSRTSRRAQPPRGAGDTAGNEHHCASLICAYVERRRMKQTYASGRNGCSRANRFRAPPQWAAGFAVLFADWFAKVPQLHGSADSGFLERGMTSLPAFTGASAEDGYS
jgi:hypothetical protein